MPEELTKRATEGGKILSRRGIARLYHQFLAIVIFAVERAGLGLEVWRRHAGWLPNGRPSFRWIIGVTSVDAELHRVALTGKCFRTASVLQQFGPVDDQRQTVLIGRVLANSVDEEEFLSAASHGEPRLGSRAMLEKQLRFPDFEILSGADLRLEYLIVGTVK